MGTSDPPPLDAPRPVATDVPVVPVFASLSVARQRRLVLACVAGVAFAAASAGAYPFAFESDVKPAFAALLLTTPWLAVLAAHVALTKGTTPTRAVGIVVGLSALLGVLNGAFGAVALAVVKGEAGIAILGTIFAFFFGMPTGVVYGLVMAPLVGVAAHSATRSEVEPSERVLFTSGAWLAATSALVLAVSLGLELRGIGLATAPVLGLVAIALGVLGAARRLRRARWLAAARRGELAGFRVRASQPEDYAEPRELLRVRADFREVEDEEVLEWAPQVGASAYRAAAAIPVALVPAARRR